ncbi:MAG: hypothetical protein JWQ69_121 [Pseudomonas sp.]|nr:hypothetical protein [Pseudomonas sp.]
MSNVLHEDDLQALMAQAHTDGLELSDLKAICLVRGIDSRQVLNELAINVAKGFLSGSLTYDFCDCVMNGIFIAITDLSMSADIPQPAFSIYLAFDEGEWRRAGDSTDICPWEKYTRPRVEAILRGLNLSFLC